jgi:anti-sigma B factor antagonist
MEISTKQLKRVTVVNVDGRIDHSTCPRLEEALQGLIGGGTYNIVMDMDGVEYISSAGLRALLAARKAVRRFNRGDLRLANVHEYVRKTFDLVGFTQIFTIYDDLVQAVGDY